MNSTSRTVSPENPLPRTKNMLPIHQSTHLKHRSSRPQSNNVSTQPVVRPCTTVPITHQLLHTAAVPCRSPPFLAVTTRRAAHSRTTAPITGRMPCTIHSEWHFLAFLTNRHRVTSPPSPLTTRPALASSGCRCSRVPRGRLTSSVYGKNLAAHSVASRVKRGGGGAGSSGLSSGGAVKGPGLHAHE